MYPNPLVNRSTESLVLFRLYQPSVFKNTRRKVLIPQRAKTVSAEITRKALATLGGRERETNRSLRFDSKSDSGFVKWNSET